MADDEFGTGMSMVGMVVMCLWRPLEWVLLHVSDSWKDAENSKFVQLKGLR